MKVEVWKMIPGPCHRSAVLMGEVNGSLEIDCCAGDILPQDLVDILCDQQGTTPEPVDQQGATHHQEAVPQPGDFQGATPQPEDSDEEDLCCDENYRLINLCDEIDNDDFDNATLD